MAKIIVKDSKNATEFKQISPGAHFAICNAVIELGLQPGFDGGRSQQKIYVRWEVSDERVEFNRDGVTIEGPMSIGKMYTMSLNEKASLRADLENWRGKAFTEQELGGFDVANLIGKSCQLMMVHAEAKGKTYANVKGVMGVSKDQRERARTANLENKPLLFSIADWDQSTYEAIPQWLREKILNRLDDKAMTAIVATVATPDFDDSIPF